MRCKTGLRRGACCPTALRPSPPAGEGKALNLSSILHLLSDLTAQYSACAGHVMKFVPETGGSTLLNVMIRTMLPFPSAAQKALSKNAKAISDLTSHFLVSLMVRHATKLTADLIQVSAGVMELVCARGGRFFFEQLSTAGRGGGRQPQKRLDRRLEEVAKAVGGGCCRLQMP